MILVGCPVYERGWILPTWFEHLSHVRDDRAHFVFAYTPGEDNTLDVIEYECGQRGYSFDIITVTDGTHSAERNWQQKGRIQTMADMRNQLLDFAHRMSPDYYLSLDSDILLPDGAVDSLCWSVKNTEYDAVSPVTWLSHLPEITNAFYRDKHTLRRVKVMDGLQPADVLCAAICMSREVVESTSYDHFPRGEDFAWSESAQVAGFKLGIDTRIKAKHIM
jgi:hypothetical protein